MNTTFTYTAFKILLFQGRSVLAPTQWGRELKHLSFSVNDKTLPLDNPVRSNKNLS